MTIEYVAYVVGRLSVMEEPKNIKNKQQKKKKKKEEKQNKTKTKKKKQKCLSHFRISKFIPPSFIIFIVLFLVKFCYFLSNLKP